MDDLEQRVRDLIWQACHDDLMVAEAARAIIPMVLEHAAKVADAKIDYATAIEAYDDGHNDAARDIAAAIRAMKEAANG